MACLPGRTHADCHDALRDAVVTGVLQAGIRGEMEVGHIFAAVLPVMAQGDGSGIVPDARLTVDLPRDGRRLPPVPRGMRRSAAELAAAARRHDAPLQGRTRVVDQLFDIKTIHSGGPDYRSPLARDAQGGAVTARARRVDGEYAALARELDRKRLQQDPQAAPGEVMRVLRSYPAVRALVVGQYGECSADVHSLLEAAAQAAAARRWRVMGARDASEAVGYFTTALRRSWGVAAVREMARHRLRRVCFVGVSHARARVLAGPRADAQPVGAPAGAPPWALAMLPAFHAHQGRRRGPP